MVVVIWCVVLKLLKLMVILRYGDLLFISFIMGIFVILIIFKVCGVWVCLVRIRLLIF